MQDFLLTRVGMYLEVLVARKHSRKLGPGPVEEDMDRFPHPLSIGKFITYSQRRRSAFGNHDI